MKAEVQSIPPDVLPESLKSAFQNIENKSLAESRKRMDKEEKENSKILERLNNDTFNLSKDLLIVAGTIFGSSIALAAGRTVNNRFIFGEFFLFLSLISGLIILLTHLKGKEWDYSFSSKNSIEAYLLLNKKRIDKFELDNLEDLVKSHNRLLASNQRGILYLCLKIIRLERLHTIFYVTFLIGVLLILISIIPQSTFNSIYQFILDVKNH